MSKRGGQKTRYIEHNTSIEEPTLRVRREYESVEMRSSIILLCLAQVATLLHNAHGAQIGSDLSDVIEKCHKKLEFKTIAEFADFLRKYKSSVASGASAPAGSNKWVEKCFSEREAILALGELVESYDRKRACKYDNVARLEQFARKHLLANRRSITLKFFTLFGVNIALGCKVNLLAHLRQADMEADQIDFIYSMAAPAGWSVLVNEHTKKSMKFGSSSNVGNNLINRIAKLVPGLNQVEQLELMDFGHALNSERPERELGSYRPSSASVAGRLREWLRTIKGSCENLDRFYVNSVLSLAKLSQLGLSVGVLNEQHESSQLLHKWLAAASFCQLMVRVRLAEEPAEALELELVHEDGLLEGRLKLYSYVSEFAEISAEARELVWQASVMEGKWCQASRAMFRPELASSVAMSRLLQYIRGLECDLGESAR